MGGPLPLVTLLNIFQPTQGGSPGVQASNFTDILQGSTTCWSDVSRKSLERIWTLNISTCAVSQTVKESNKSSYNTYFSRGLTTTQDLLHLVCSGPWGAAPHCLQASVPGPVYLHGFLSLKIPQTWAMEGGAVYQYCLENLFRCSPLEHLSGFNSCLDKLCLLNISILKSWIFTKFKT